jgi:hypothetical protein
MTSVREVQKEVILLVHQVFIWCKQKIVKGRYENESVKGLAKAKKGGRGGCWWVWATYNNPTDNKKHKQKKFAPREQPNVHILLWVIQLMWVHTIRCRTGVCYLHIWRACKNRPKITTGLPFRHPVRRKTNNQQLLKIFSILTTSIPKKKTQQIISNF